MDGQRGRDRKAERGERKQENWGGAAPSGVQYGHTFEAGALPFHVALGALGKGALSLSTLPLPLLAPEPSHPVGIFQSLQWPVGRTRSREGLEATGSRKLAWHLLCSSSQM